jgi:6-phosphogluconate dehydrogenase
MDHFHIMTCTKVGALTGPSLMPGGQEAAYNKVSDILDAISAKAQDHTDEINATFS